MAREDDLWYALMKVKLLAVIGDMDHELQSAALQKFTQQLPPARPRPARELHPTREELLEKIRGWRDTLAAIRRDKPDPPPG